MEREYVVGLRIKVDEDVIEEYGDIQSVILETTEDVPFSFDVETVMEM